MTTEPKISLLVTQAIKGLRGMAQELVDDVDTHANSHSLASSYLSRFKLWAGSLGAHRPSGTKSLEYKLRDASLIRNHILSLLRDLCGSIDHARGVIATDYTAGNDTKLDEGSDSIDDSIDDELAGLFYSDDEEANNLSELDQALGRVSNTINNLLRLSATIRNPAPHDHFKSKAVDLIRAYEPRYKDHIKHRFANLGEVLVDRLAKSMTRRREYFRYREEHVTRLAAGMDKIEAGEDHDEAQSERRTISTAISSLPDHLKDHAVVATGGDDFEKLDDVRSLASQATTYAATEAESGELRVPETPVEFQKGEAAKCPFCHVFVSIPTRYDWKKHVFRDLQPYNCLENDCPMPNHQFERRSEWAEHMRRQHWKVWHCPLGCLDAITFSNVAELNHHLHSTHGQDVSASLDERGRIPSGTRFASCVPDFSKACGPCPVCVEVNITSEKHYVSHVGAHLKQLALFVLPRLEYEGDESNKDEDNEVSNDSARSIGSVDTTSSQGDIGYNVQSWQQNQLAASSSESLALNETGTSKIDDFRTDFVPDGIAREPYPVRTFERQREELASEQRQTYPGEYRPRPREISRKASVDDTVWPYSDSASDSGWDDQDGAEQRAPSYDEAEYENQPPDDSSSQPVSSLVSLSNNDMSLVRAQLIFLEKQNKERLLLKRIRRE
ncbi:hypothetical protein B0T13DRAFT_50138 [Neurospora crassa]|nr:hypothetical protein B0T13DRAFT_50138 [Neurospora crassa]